jgi:hypothetical protein
MLRVWRFLFVFFMVEMHIQKPEGFIARMKKEREKWKK